jgi:hypothetical protein
MREQRITVTIDADGKMSAKTNGIKGEACIEELEALLTELAELDEIEHTREYHEKDPRAAQSTQSNIKLGERK